MSKVIFDRTCCKEKKYSDTVQGDSRVEGVCKKMTLELRSGWWAKLVIWEWAEVPSSEKKKEVQRLQDNRVLGMFEELEQVGEDEAGRVDRTQIT